MFMRVGGGIYTKAADVGADLVGKVEQGIPEDDPRNAATIADNVGDNVGDCAGMAADLFESYSVMLVAALILGRSAFGNDGLVFPLIIPAIGVLTAIVGIFSVAPRVRDRSGMTAINRGFFISAIISVIGVAIACFTFLPSHFSSFQGITDATISAYNGNPRWIAFGAILIGIVLASAIQLLTGYFTETNRRPVRDIGQSSETGAATVILSGVSIGMESAVYSALLIAGAVFCSYLLATGNATIALFAVAMAGSVTPFRSLNLAGRKVKEAIATPMTEIRAETKKPRLIAVMPLRSPRRGETEKIPITAVITPIIGTISGKTRPLSPNALLPRISEATSMTA
jgi:K(+)-stimulated pyrophosphate-energized sodium pump